MDKDRIINFINTYPELVQVKNQGPGITVLKYKRKVFFKNLWTPELCEMRGTVVDDDFNIVQRPFTKIFNYTEDKAPKIALDTPVTAVQKINGFMAAASKINGELFISTTGSTESPFVALARKHIEPLNWRLFDENLTYIFEICDDSDPHVVPEDQGPYLLGARRKTWDSEQHTLHEEVLDMFADALGALRPTWYHVETFNQLLKTVKKVTHEGFVVWDSYGNEVKIKSPFYLATKFFGRKNEAKVRAILKNPDTAKKIIDEEYYPVIDYIGLHREFFIQADEQEKMQFLREFFETNIIGN